MALMPSPRNADDLVSDAGSSVTIVVDDSRFAGWNKLELYDGVEVITVIHGARQLPG
jgi:hypothetical protein